MGCPGNAAESSGSNDQCLREYSYINETSEEARLGKGSNEIKEGENPKIHPHQTMPLHGTKIEGF